MNPFEESKKYFSSPIQEFQYFDKYSRWRDDLGRRETWKETVQRAVNSLKTRVGFLDSLDFYKIENFILEMKVMPSMRLVAMAGPALDRNNICAYNCSFLGVDSVDAFSEALLISMCGCGVGFSVEQEHINKLPNLPISLVDTGKIFTIDDTTEGWVNAVKYHINSLYNGEIANFDYSQLRPSGAILKTKGGRSSGPNVLKETINFITQVFVKSISNFQKNLKPIDAHDIMCSIGNCAVSGGTRRTAMISLFDIDNLEMQNAKIGNYHHYRYNANNSAVWPENITKDQYLKQMHVMFSGYTGEPGIWAKESLKLNSRRDHLKIKGVNPCGEINLRNMQFCNLSSVICRPDDTVETLEEKVIIATQIGTLQSMFTHFPGLREDWRRNCEEERLLGVDLNGQMDCNVLNYDLESGGYIREHLREVAIKTNKKLSEKLNINQSTSVTCVKPNGNSGVLVNASSGMHPRFAPFYIRNVRVSTSSPIYKTLFEHGVPMSPENGQDWSNITTAVVSFPVKSPAKVKTSRDFSAIDMLNNWKINKLCYTEHNPSVTIYYNDDESEQILNWVWENKSIVGGLTFMPRDDAKYNNMPYVEITEDEYNKRLKEFPNIDWSRIEYWEKEDQTNAAQEAACVSGSCDIL